MGMRTDPATPENDFEWWIPITKSERQKDGSFTVYGIAADEQEDHQDEIIDAGGMNKCLQYMKEWGKLDLEHGKPVIGDLTDAWQMSNAEARKEFPGVDVVGTATVIKGRVHPVTEWAPEDLKTVHHYHKVGMPLGFSIWGQADKAAGRVVKSVKDGRDIKVVVPKMIPRVAITAQPVRTNSVCFAKSWSEALTMDRPETDAGEPYPILLFGKGLSAGYQTDAAQMTGGQSLIPESLLGSDDSKGKRCPHCGRLVDTVTKSFADTVDGFAKALKGEGSRGGKVIGHTKSGKPIYGRSHKAYTSRHKVAKWNIQPDAKQEPRLLKRTLPDYSAEDHVEAAHKHAAHFRSLSGKHSRLIDRASSKAGVDALSGGWTAGGTHPKFSDAENSAIREHAFGAQAHKDIARAHWKAAGKRSSYEF